MGKLKLSLVSGTVVEKPLINAFKANNNVYVVLDNEMNGSMGLPIILVSKMVDNKLTKILDQNEWQVVKECLKNIIGGGQIESVTMPNEMNADDIYYTQLTLPVPSFDALKNSYKVEADDTKTDNGVGIMDFNPNQSETAIQNADVNAATNVSSSPDSPSIPEMNINVTSNDSSVDNSINFGMPLQGDSNSSNEMPTTTATENPGSVPDVGSIIGGGSELVSPTGITNSSVAESDLTGSSIIPEVAPVSPIPTVNSEPVVASSVTPMPEINNVEDKYKEEKEKFMKACEELFNSIIKKIEDNKN